MMNKWLNYVIGILFLFTLSGCIAEDYDIGVPSAYIEVQAGSSYLDYPLTEATIEWSSSSGDVNQTVEKTEEFGLKQDKMPIYTNSEARFDLIENEDNGGSSSWPDSFTVALWKNGERTILDVNEDGEFIFPETEGTYVLELYTVNSTNRAQYVGRVELQKQDTTAWDVKADLPALGVEPLSIQIKEATDEENERIAHEYATLCWNSCNGQKQPIDYDMNLRTDNIEIGDTFQIKWNNMNPKPTEIQLPQLDKKTGAVIETAPINVSKATLETEVTEENKGTHYALEFYWKEGTKLIGKTFLHFGLE